MKGGLIYLLAFLGENNKKIIVKVRLIDGAALPNVQISTPYFSRSVFINTPKKNYTNSDKDDILLIRFITSCPRGLLYIGGF
jgi:hypothetical protein